MRVSRRRRRRRWFPLLGLLPILLGWGGLTAKSLLQARSHALAGIQQLETMRAGLDPARADFAQLASDFDLAAGDFAVAESETGRPWVRAAGKLPWFATQIASVDALANAAQQLASALADAARTGAKLQAALPKHETEAATAAATARDALANVLPAFDVGLGPRRNLLPQLASAHTQLASERTKLRATVTDAHTVIVGLAAVFDSTRFLLLLNNPSEMRVGQGAILQIAVLTFGPDGQPKLTTPETVSINTPLEARRPLDGDLARNWGFLFPNQYWQGLAMTPRLPAIAAQAASMYATLDPEPVDGVITLDQVGLAGLLKLTGPLTAPGVTITADNAADVFGNGQYTNFAANQTARKEFLADAAVEVFARLASEPMEPLALVRALRPAAQAGHLRAWSSDPKMQAAWQKLGIDGDVGPDDLLVGLSNHQSNKLDYFTRISASMNVTSLPGDRAEVALQVTINNTVPPGQPDYVTGAAPNRPTGLYYGFLALSIPGSSASISMDEAQLLPSNPTLADQQALFIDRVADATVVNAADGASHQIAVSVAIEPGQSIVRTLRFTVGRDVAARLRVLPSGRYPQIEWTTPGITDAQLSPAGLKAGR